MDRLERRDSADILAETERRFQAVFNNAAVGIDVLDQSGKFVEVNSALARMLGYSKEELLQMGPMDLTHPDDLAESKECLRRLVEGEIDSYRFEKRYVRKDGSIMHADIMVSKILDSEGHYASTVGVISDVTERKLAENALRIKTIELGERVKELKCLFDISLLRERNDLSIEETFKGVVDLLPRAWRHPEVACARIILPGREFRSRNFRPPVAKQSADILAQGKLFGVVEVGYAEERPESDEGPFLKEERSLINEIARRLGRVVERAQAAEELQRYHAELERLVDERTRELVKINEQLSQEIRERRKAEEVLQESARALERSNRDLEQFAYVAAHDLREPLVGVAAYLKLLERRAGKLLDEGERRYLSKALDTVVRMDRLVQGLLAYSRVADNQRGFEPTDCGACFASAVANLQTAIKESGAVITADPMPTVRGIPLHITQLFQNLLGNAIKFRGDAPLRIHVGVRTDESEHLFFVKDNGVGIERPYFDRIFQIFQRGEQSLHIQGTGIGLATCKKIVERHGGRIWVESEPGCGAAFFFTLPHAGSSKGDAKHNRRMNGCGGTRSGASGIKTYGDPH
jgi:PAS domain S-box-containing protein